MRSLLPPNLALFAGAAVFAAAALCLDAQGDEQSVAPRALIQLKSNAEVSDKIVRVADIAEVTGEDVVLVSSIAGLDVADPPAEAQPTRLSRDQVVIRIRLAGLSPKSFDVQGPDSVTIRRKPQPRINDQFILEELQLRIANRLHVNVDDLQVELTRPVMGSVVNKELVQLELKTILPDKLQPGRNYVRLAFYRDQNLIRTVPVSLDVRVLREIAVASRSLSRGDILSEENVVFERRPLSSRFGDFATRNILGKTARRQIEQGETIRARDASESRGPTNPLVIRTRDIVRMRAERGSLKVVVPDAEALESGRVGDYIRVRNQRSRRIVRARVLGPAEVVVQF